MIKQELIKFIEKNIDLEPKVLLVKIKSEFKEKYSQEEIEGIFRSAGQLITLFKDYTQEEVSSDMHDRLMSRLKNDQAKYFFPKK